MRTKQKAGAAFGQQLNKKKQCDVAISSNSDTSEDEVDEIVVLKKDTQKQRFSVSAEAYGKFNKKENFKAKFIPKTPDQKQRISERMSQGFMFNNLDEKNREIVIGAMEEKLFKQGEWVIKQGEDGNVLYVVDVGELDCYKTYSDGEKYLKTYYPGESFGELALLFCSPRAASIRVKSATAILWQLDRETFNMIVKEASIKRREKYEQFLMTWELLKELDDDPYEKLKMSDALEERVFKSGQVICEQNAKLNDILIIQQGAVGLFQNNKQLLQLDKLGQYFGDISIVMNQPEIFKSVALTDVQCYYITRKSYTTTLKIIENTMTNRIKSNYGKYM